MKTLITIRDSIKDFISKYDKFVMPVIKFIATFLVLVSFGSVMGYSADMSSPALMFLISLICAFLPIQLTVLIIGIVGFLHMYAVSLDVAGTYAGMFVIMYLLYLRFAPKYGWLVILMPLFYMLKLHYMVPIIVGIFIGPVGIVPVAFGVIFYYFTQHVSDLVDLLATVSEEDSIQGFNYIINGLLQDKPMLLTIVVFAIVIAVTYFIYRQSFQYSWMIAIGTGAVLSIVLFLMGGIVLETDINILIIFVGTVGGALLAVVAQFFKGILDYSRTESVQFEDDEYYYYVKAIPKIRVAEQNVKVKKINEKKERVPASPYTGAQKQTQQQVYDNTRKQVQNRTRSAAQSPVRNTVQNPVRNTAQEHSRSGVQNQAGRTAETHTRSDVQNQTRSTIHSQMQGNPQKRTAGQSEAEHMNQMHEQ